MIEMDMLFWGGLIVLFIVAEIATTALVSIWFVFGALAAFGGAAWGMSFLNQCIVFTVVSVVMFVATRRFVRWVKKPKIPTNADRIPGMSGVTLTEVGGPHHGGRVRVHGLDWLAQSSDGAVLPPGTPILVDRLDGVTLYVSKTAQKE